MNWKWERDSFLKARVILMKELEGIKDTLGFDKNYLIKNSKMDSL